MSVAPRITRIVRLSAIVICLLSCLSTDVYAQQQQIDSLKSVLDRHGGNDSVRVKLLVALAHNYQFTHVDSMMVVAEQGRRIADRIHFKSGKADCLLLLGIASGINGSYNQGLTYAAEALRIFRDLNDRKGEARTLNVIAGVYYHTSRYDLAMEYFNASLDIWKKVGEPKGIGGGYINIGNVYSDFGNYPEALAHYLKGLRAFEQIGDQISISTALSNIASTYTDLGKYKEAIDYNSQSLKINEASGNKRGIIQNLSNIGIAYTSQGKDKEALGFFLKAEALAEETSDHYWTYLSKDNIASVYAKLGIYDKALKYYEACLEAAGDLDDPTGTISAKTGIAGILLKEGRHREAIDMLQSAFVLAKDAMLNPEIWRVSRQLAAAYEQTGDYRKALEYYKIENIYDDSLHNEATAGKMQRLQFDYKMKKKEDEIKLLQRDRIIARQVNEKQRIIVAGLTIGLLLISALAVMLYRNHKRIRQSKKILLQQKEEMQHQAVRLQEMNLFKDRVISILSHDIRSPLNAFESTLSLLEAGIITQDEFNEIKKEMKHLLDAIHSLIDNLVLWSKGNMEEQKDYHEVIDLYHIVHQNISLLKSTATRKHITLNNKLPEGLAINGNRNEIDTVIRNLMTNAIKFTGANGEVNVDASLRNGLIEISVSDNGVGMSREHVERLFSKDVKTGNYGTGGEKGSGLGLMLCREFIEKHGSRIVVTSEVGKGSTFKIILPAASLQAGQTTA